MLDLAPPTGPGAARRSTVDHVATALGRAFVDAIVAGDFDRLEALFAPDVRFRAIIPGEVPGGLDGRRCPRDHRGLVRRDGPHGSSLGSTVDLVGDRLAIGYRLELTDDGERRVVEQHVAATVDGASFRDLAVVCSGFRPLATDRRGASATRGTDASPGDDDHAEAPAFTPAAHLDATGLSCATLTPTISATVRGLDFGAVLEIVTDDPEAEEGLRSWTRLTGNELRRGRGRTRVGPPIRHSSIAAGRGYHRQERDRLMATHHRQRHPRTGGSGARDHAVRRRATWPRRPIRTRSCSSRSTAPGSACADAPDGVAHAGLPALPRGDVAVRRERRPDLGVRRVHQAPGHHAG